MPYTKLNINGAQADVLSWVGHGLSEDEQKMLRNVSRLPVLFKHVALMPDAHLGIGSMVGSVVATKEAVIPATVGVDIGCGMMAVKTPFRGWVLDRKLKQLRDEIESAIPVGFKENRDPNSEAANWDRWAQFPALHEKVQERFGKARKQLGTLGGGNHFIEVCLDTDGIVWLMLHSGSRNIGNELATHHIKAARQLHDLQTLPDPNLAYFLQGTPEFAAYWHDLDWAQAYALKNREVMMNNLLAIVYRMFNDGEPFDPEITVNCHHNYVSIEEHYGEEVFVTRKGAIRADEGRLGIIPGSMGAKSFIVKGLGAAESFSSCSHGAGRKMSRTAARKKFSAKDLAEQTLGVECRKDNGVVDEIPGAYKDIAEVMRNQADLVEVVAELKQVVCVKG
ncbi:MAG TPA: RtcB family protein [Pyrinomonadaceae bacterium]|jgi:tRNA-splicing ligase RtcB|nr:RtcB family protein [Pyrinomonadaceae bacterium]